MTWLFILGLLVWTLFQQARLNDLRQQVLRLTDQVARLIAGEQKPAAQPRPALRSAAETVSALVEPAEIPAAVPAPQPTAALAAPPRIVRPAATVAPRTTASASGPPTPSALEWLSENGLAWLGGGALALGGLLLVAFAVQRGFFTPAMRVASASVLGLAAIGVGEWLRRRKTERESYALVAALTTAAGAAILYAAVW